jgi:hypothetical protein
MEALARKGRCLIKRFDFKIQIGQIPVQVKSSQSKSAHFRNLPALRLSFGLSAGALRCVVYRDCTARLLKAGRVDPVEQHSHRCPVATSARLFVRSTFELVTHKFRIPGTHPASRSPTPRHLASRRIHVQLPLNSFEKMDKVRVTILLAVCTPRLRCAASLHPSGKRLGR